MKILVTGGCGFMGSNFIHYMLKNTDYQIINYDGLTYSTNPKNLKDIENDENYRFIYGRIESGEDMLALIQNVEYLVNFAAESNVDKSIFDPQPFIITNILGTCTLLEACRHSHIKKIVHVSTDEVYGELGKTGKFIENSPLLPNSPYSATKASADLIIRTYYRTYGLPIAIVRPSNNYGYYQYPDKFIPLIITNLLEDKPIPVYGDGKNIRDWIFVEDCCEGIAAVLENGKKGEVYNIGGENEKRNIDIVKIISKLLKKNDSHIKFVGDRPGHDYRYALDNSKIRKELGWTPKMTIETGLIKTVEWYKNNLEWWKPLKERLARVNQGFWS